MTPEPTPEPSLSLSATWGTTAAERALPFPCDALVPAPDAVLYRGVTVTAPAEIVYRWLCQMRVAPYSYDWIDNLGRRSPQRLIDGLDDLAVGQDVMRIFTLAAFERDRHLTIRTKARGATHEILGGSAATYLIVPEPGGRCRLLVKIVLRHPPGLTGWLMRHFLPWGDLVMMRRQLLNLKRLAEATPSALRVYCARLSRKLKLASCPAVVVAKAWHCRQEDPFWMVVSSTVLARKRGMLPFSHSSSMPRPRACPSASTPTPSGW